MSLASSRNVTARDDEDPVFAMEPTQQPRGAMDTLGSLYLEVSGECRFDLPSQSAVYSFRGFYQRDGRCGGNNQD